MNRFISAHLETGRISNLPTVVSNVFIAWVLSGNDSTTNLAWIFLAASFLYVGGCYLGDAKDVTFDTEHRPSRPIPSGVITRQSVWGIGSLFMLLGTAIFLYVGKDHSLSLITSVLLASVISGYALLHKRSLYIGLPLIGACRGLLILASIAAFSPDIDRFSWIEFTIASCVALYTICFASVARLESSPEKFASPNLLKYMMFGLGLIPLVLIATNEIKVIYFLIGFAVYVNWLLFAFVAIDKNKGLFVSYCLAGFALLDLAIISPMGPTNMMICLVLFIFALILQRVAPAT